MKLLGRERNRRGLVLLFAELICVLLLLPGCFRKAELAASFEGRDMELAEETEGQPVYRSAQIPLAPGVYQVRVWADLGEGQTFSVKMEGEDANYHTLRENGVIVFSGEDYLEFPVYAVDRIPSAYLQFWFQNVGTEGLLKAEIYKTGQGNRFLFLLALAAFVLLDLLLAFRRKILEGKISKRQQTVVWTLIAGVLLAYFPYLTDGFMLGYDTTFHLSRIANLTAALRQGGGWPVYVQPGWLFGHGYAVSLFYSDLFLLLPAFLYGNGFSLMAAYKILILLVVAATGGIAYHSFYQCVRDEYAALAASMMYLLMPYHLVNLYNRGALGECMAMAFLPLVFCGVYLLYTQDVTGASYRNYKWYIVWGASGVLQAHVLSTEMMVLAFLFIGIVFWKRTFRKRTFWQLAEAAGIALLLNLWFWLPMVSMLGADRYRLQEITGDAIQSGGVTADMLLQTFPRMGNTLFGVQSGAPVQVGAAALLLIALYLIWAFRTGKGNRICNVLAVFSILGIWMSTRYFPWDALARLPLAKRLITTLQFPWRLLVLAGPAVSLLAGFFFLRVKELGGSAVRTARNILIAAFWLLAVYHVNSIAFQAPAAYLYAAEGMGTIQVGNGEYLLEETALEQLRYHGPAAEEGLQWSGYEKQGTTVWVSLKNTAEEMRRLEVPLTGYRGYAVTADPDRGDPVPRVSEQVGEHGDLILEVPAGYQGDIRIAYEGFPVFSVAESVSWISLLALAAAFLRKAVRSAASVRHRSTPPEAATNK